MPLIGIDNGELEKWSTGELETTVSKIDQSEMIDKPLAVLFRPMEYRDRPIDDLTTATIPDNGETLCYSKDGIGIPV